MTQSARSTLLGEAIAHALHDTWFGVAPILLAAVSTPLQLSNSDIGLMLLVYQGISSLTQPLFGRLAERFGGRVFAVGAILWTTLMFTGTLFAPNKLVMGILIALAGFGSGSFHPQGTTNATIAGGSKYGATAASLFFFGGMIGTAVIGSALGGFLIGNFGQRSLVVLSVAIMILTLTVVRWSIPRELAQSPIKPALDQRPNQQEANSTWAIIVVLLAAIALRSLTQQTLTTYTPKFQNDLGVPPAVYGVLLSLFLVANATGGVLGSYLGDRIGFRQVLVGSLMLAALALLAFTRLEGLVSQASFVLAGLFLGPAHTLLLVSGQRRFPHRMATISGVFLGFTFVSGAGGTWLLGLLADRIGLGSVFAFLPIFLVLGAIFAVIAVPSHAAEVATSLSKTDLSVDA